MAIIINNIKLSIAQDEKVAIKKAIEILRIDKANIKNSFIFKKSLDARKKDKISYVYSVIVDLLCNEEEVIRKIKNPNVKHKAPNDLSITTGNNPLKEPVYVVGFGPTGILCSYVLAMKGYNPIVIERGYDVDKRVHAVENFWNNAILDKNSNVQFGEGGAGTFSDGKLTTRISDVNCEFVLKTLVKFGAPKEILYTAKPHIGTDKLRDVIKNIRKEIINMGGKILFEHKLENIIVKNKNIVGIIVNGEKIDTQNVVLAIGHSARDTFRKLHEENVFIEAKSFSVGARIEHLQTDINEALYGENHDKFKLPQGEYQLSYRENDVGVYTFCMCPGGVVVPSSSSENQVVTNGMSEYARNSKNANSALVVSVTPNDFGTNPLDGMLFQEKIESDAFKLAGSNYKACGVTVDNFLNSRVGINLNRITPSYSLGLSEVDFFELYPKFIVEMMQKGLRVFDRKIKGFATNDAVLTGPETRTSSPIRITRNDEGQSLNIKGLYPCGEGAGYAGGIVSAAVDGIKIAIKIIENYTPFN